MGKKLSSYNQITEVTNSYKLPLFTTNTNNFWAAPIDFLKSKIGAYKSSTTGITAYAGGGQANATAMTGEFNNVATVASLGDSVLLDNAVVGKRMIVYNTGAKSMDVYPKTSEVIGGLSVNGAFRIAPSDYLDVICYATGVWLLNKYEYLFRQDIATAAVLTLNGTPVTVFQAISGFDTVVEWGLLGVTFNSVAYATNTTLMLITDTATYQQHTAFLTATVTSKKRFSLGGAGAGDTQIITNKAILAKVDSGNPTAGNSDIVIYGKVKLMIP